MLDLAFTNGCSIVDETKHLIFLNASDYTCLCFNVFELLYYYVIHDENRVA